MPSLPMLPVNIASSLLVTVLVIALVLAYFCVTGYLVRKKARLLWIPTLLVLLSGTLFYWMAYGKGGAVDPFPRLVLSLSATIDLFLFKLNTTYGNFTDLFYQLGDSPEALIAHNNLITAVGLYLCAIWTTILLVVHFLARRVESMVVLSWRVLRQQVGNTCLFIGISPESLAVARSLPKGFSVIFIDLPNTDFEVNKLSVAQLLRGLRYNSDLTETVKDVLPDALVVKARIPLGRCLSADLFKDLGLRKLNKWMARKDTHVFLLSPQYRENLSALEKLSAWPAQIYCNAPREGLAQRMELAAPQGNIHIIDASFLATKTLKTLTGLYPIHLVDIGRNAKGQPAGYVNSAFNALICGFGASGQGALAFLYEFGAFPGKDKQQSPFSCDVFDKDMDVISGTFCAGHPGIDPQKVHFRQSAFGSAEFWETLSGRIATLNYVYISLGEDNLNTQAALDLLTYASRHRETLEHFVILVKLDRPAAFRPIIDYYNRCLGGTECIHTIGDINSVWTWDNITDSSYMSAAQSFYKAYAISSGESQTWEDRDKAIMGKPNSSDLSHRLEIRRKKSQDFANCFHSAVKQALVPAYLWEDPSVAAGIPYQMQDNRHYLGPDKDTEEILDYLAVGEHIRWVSSHEASGYRVGPLKREDLMTHPDIRPYYQLEEYVKHYDWVVVKTTLDFLRAKNEHRYDPA